MPSAVTITVLAGTMDSEYPAPIPYIRPVLTCDSSVDAQIVHKYALPTPCTTSLTPSPNSTQKKKRNLPSRFEQLPPELRIMMYRLLRYPVSGNIWLRCRPGCCSSPSHKRPSTSGGLPEHRDDDFEVRVKVKNVEFWYNDGSYTFLNHDGPTWYARNKCCAFEWVSESAMMKLNHWIREDIFRLVNPFANAEFHYALSDKTNYRWLSRPHGWTILPPRKYMPFQSMFLAKMNFTSMTAITLTKDCVRGLGSRHPSADHRSHWRLPLMAFYKSIRFISRHCPRLKYFCFEPVIYTNKSTSSYAMSLLAFVIREFVENCLALECLEILSIAMKDKVEEGGFRRSYFPLEGKVFDLKDSAIYSRADRVESWVRLKISEQMGWSWT